MARSMSQDGTEFPESGPISGFDPIESLLIQRGLVSEEDVAQARVIQKESGQQIGLTLVAMGALNDRDLALALGELLNMSVVDLRRDNPEPDALALVAEEIVREHLVIPIKLNDDGLQVAVADQPSTELHASLEQSSQKSVLLVIAPLSDIQWAIDSSYRAIGGVDRLVEAFEAVEGTRKRSTVEPAATEIVADDAPVVQVVTRILTQAKRDRASDVHIEPSQDVVKVRFRIDGALKEILLLPAAMGVGLVSRIKIMAGMNIVERRRPQDGQLSMKIDGKDTDVRVSTAATIWGEKCVMRILDKNRSVLRLTTSECLPIRMRRTHDWSELHSEWSFVRDQPEAERRRRCTPPSRR